MRTFVVIACALISCALAGSFYPNRLRPGVHLTLMDSKSSRDINVLYTQYGGALVSESSSGEKFVIRNGYGEMSCIMVINPGGKSCYESQDKCSSSFKGAVLDYYPEYFKYDTNESCTCPGGLPGCTQYCDPDECLIADSLGYVVKFNGQQVVVNDDIPSVNLFESMRCSGSALSAPKYYVPPKLDCAFHVNITKGGKEGKTEEVRALYFSDSNLIMRRTSDTEDKLIITNNTLPNSYYQFFRNYSVDSYRQCQTGEKTSSMSGSVVDTTPNYCREYSSKMQVNCPDGTPYCYQYVLYGKTNIYWTVDKKERMISDDSNDVVYKWIDDELPTVDDFAGFICDDVVEIPAINPCTGEPFYSSSEPSDSEPSGSGSSNSEPSGSGSNLDSSSHGSGVNPSSHAASGVSAASIVKISFAAIVVAIVVLLF